MTEPDSILDELRGLIGVLDRTIQDLGAIRTRAAEILAGRPAAPVDAIELERRIRELANRSRLSRASGPEAVICPICGGSSNSVRNLRRHVRRSHLPEISKPTWREAMR